MSNWDNLLDPGLGSPLLTVLLDTCEVPLLHEDISREKLGQFQDTVGHQSITPSALKLGIVLQ